MSLLKKLLYYNKSITAKYMNSRIKKVEFLLCIMFYVSLFIFNIRFQIKNPSFEQIKGVTSQLQAFVCVFMAFRFRFFGMTAVIILNAFDCLNLIIMWIHAPNMSYIIGILIRLCCIISCVIVAFLSNKQQLQKEKLHLLAITDELTGVYNQRYFHSTIEKEVEKALKNDGSVGLILIDIDNFKMYNDIYGHHFGDEILSATASILKTLSSEGSIVFRYGGDEFAIILPDSNIKHIEQVASTIRNGYTELKNKYLKNDLSKVTLSMGISHLPNMSSSKDELVKQADMALYHAKNLGKDKVHFYQDVMQQIRMNISTNHQQIIGTFKALLSTISAKDKYTLGHSERVSSYAAMIGDALGLNIKEICTLQYAGLLHDIGKVEIPQNILNKVERLTDEEYALMRKHPVLSANILEPLKGMDQLIDYVMHHHERYDGKGYPDGLSGNKISVGARILCVADSFDAMISERPYSKSKTTEDAFIELEKCSGSHFDPKIVKVFIKAMKARMAAENKYPDEIIEKHA